ncbi:Gamma-glutamyl-gamma-aminobutyrate hydrolase [Rhodovastum atsumiense]|uniref:gamma-glutamyl-gamma-aminobutyrate hydrolase n=1 Tax=Rhodovastum atsumiense TaxID=504468 RepID=A0A5M6IQ20_9PROT|nr:gamma-glutamyl-gamma-aminobutyrate hydrolase family protein [Rhodovastum atsumiense]KAA5610370.1 gamma-glutamyl-gamma-aminobutyrate hydrolase family protein [Rhodovastum atsumiense]CAH2600883.1 Gamma-glutamyl-gamma-aminobutyrate hydrolase [Rhodovastum atsumiense]
MSLIVGIPACCKEISGSIQHATPSRYGAALVGGAGAHPVLLPPVGEGLVTVLDRLDGLLLSGSPSNVEPRLYGVSHSLTPDRHDPQRDATTLPLIRAALARGLPVLAICRGIQELNVALGGTLHQQVQDLPGRMDHRGGPGTPEQRYRPKHKVLLSGQLALMLGKTETMVNSLHEQALDRPGEGVAVEALAEDGTIEAVRVTGVPGWAYGLQWHPEWQFAENEDSLAIFRAFGEACRAYAAGWRKAA